MKIWNGYRHGVNLGGWLSQCSHTIDNYEHFIVKDDFKTIGAWGLDHVRLPIDYDLFLDENFKFIDERFKYIDLAIEWAKENGLNLIIDLHKTPGFSFDLGEQEIGFFDNDKFQNIFYIIWDKLAEKYGNIGPNVSFELLNEVTDKEYMSNWNRIASNCISTIRKKAPKVTILVGGYWNNSVESVKDIDVLTDDNIVYNFHCYEPMIFTHQGASWVQEMPRDYRMSFEHTFGEYEELTTKLFAGHVGKFASMSKGNMDAPCDSEFFINFFEEAVSIAEKKNVALYCGEYGVIDLAEREDTVKWYKAINRAFEKYGIGRAAWSYKYMNFGLSDPVKDSVRDVLIKYL